MKTAWETGVMYIQLMNSIALFEKLNVSITPIAAEPSFFVRGFKSLYIDFHVKFIPNI